HAPSARIQKMRYPTDAIAGAAAATPTAMRYASAGGTMRGRRIGAASSCGRRVFGFRVNESVGGPDGGGVSNTSNVPSADMARPRSAPLDHHELEAVARDVA